MSKSHKQRTIAPITKKNKAKGKKTGKGARYRASLVPPPPTPFPEHSEQHPLEAPVTVTIDATPTESHLVPYDENLLERARTQWQFGDWDSLAKLDHNALQHHPDRAKLVLLAAAGQQQQGDTDSARQLINLAKNWGCSRRLISQMMISGVYNTLGRAAAAGGETTRMLQHFESAIATGTPGADARLITRVRTSQQLLQLGLPDGESGFQAVGTNAFLKGAASIGQPVQTLTEQIKVQSAAVAEQLKKQNVDIANARKALESTFKSEILNATKQVEAFLGLHNYINGGHLLPEMHGWPIGPDFALYLIELLESNDYDLVIEFGSGTSTVLIAKALAKIAARRQAKLTARQFAFEHLEEYKEKTLSALQSAGLADSVQLDLAPLQPYLAANGNVYPYYSCQETLVRLAQSLPPGLRVLVMVDGPPGATGKHARYPALPVVHSCFIGARIDLLLDDYIRADEREIVQLWLHDLEKWGLVGSLLEKRLEKGACLISVRDAP